MYWFYYATNQERAGNRKRPDALEERVRSKQGVGRQLCDEKTRSLRAAARNRNAYFILYFWRNFSTRPSVSTIFCLPVKNGWQAEQISTRSCGLVDRVSNVLPHAQCTVDGW